MLMYNNFQGCQSEVNDMHIKFYFFYTKIVFSYELLYIWNQPMNLGIKKMDTD